MHNFLGLPRKIFSTKKVRSFPPGILAMYMSKINSLHDLSAANSGCDGRDCASRCRQKKKYENQNRPPLPLIATLIPHGCSFIPCLFSL